MDTRTQQPTSRRWVLPFLAAIVAVLATLLSSASASAATTPGTETRVRASAAVVDVLVEPPQSVSAGERPGEAAPGVETTVATGVAANGGANAVRVGQAGENAVRSAYRIGDKTPFNVLGRDRIADGMTATTVSEVKNVGYQAYTQQLKDYATFSIDTGRRFDLFVRGGANPTRLSSQVEEAVGLGQINLRYIP
jgi:hypothetical protein